MVRLFRTFSNCIFTGDPRCAGCLCTSSGWFKHIEPPRTFLNHIIAEIARCVEFFHMSSDCTEPSLTTSLRGTQGVQGSYALVRGGSSASDLIEPHHCSDSKVCRVLSHELGVVRLFRNFSNYIFIGDPRCTWCLCTSSGWFTCIEPPRTFSNHIIAEIERFVEFFHMSSWWFDCTEPSLTMGETRCAGCLCTSLGWFKRTEPLRTFSNHVIAEIARCVEFCHLACVRARVCVCVSIAFEQCSTLLSGTQHRH